MATAVVSCLSGRPVRHDLAMTGELTLSGRVLQGAPERASHSATEVMVSGMGRRA